MAAAAGGVKFLNRSDATVTSTKNTDKTARDGRDATHKLPDAHSMITPSLGPQVVTHKHAHSDTKAPPRAVKWPAECVITAFVRCQQVIVLKRHTSKKDP